VNVLVQLRIAPQNPKTPQLLINMDPLMQHIGQKRLHPEPEDEEEKEEF